MKRRGPSSPVCWEVTIRPEAGPQPVVTTQCSLPGSRGHGSLEVTGEEVNGVGIEGWGHWRVGRGPPSQGGGGGESLPEKAFGIIEANGLSGNRRKSRSSIRIQAKGRGIGWKVGSQGIPKILIIGASLHPRRRQAPGVWEGLVGGALPVVDVCGVRVYQHPSDPVLGSVHSLREVNKTVFRARGRRAQVPFPLPSLLWKICLPTGKRMLAPVLTAVRLEAATDHGAQVGRC